MELPNQEDGKIPINITTNITRATDTAFENGDKVGLFVVNVPNALKVSGNHADNICHTYSGSWTAKTPIYWLDESTKADFYCYYPYSSTISSVDAYPFSVRADQKDEANYKASDFLWGKTTGVAPTKNSVNISVKHAMSNVIVKLVPGSGYTHSDMAAASVSICGLKTSSTINLATGEVIATGRANDITPKKEKDGQYRALVVPQSVTDTDLIKVTVGD
ncbi:MAG: fimbrillin family protein, partial [Bacteroidaceae bacterium]|nr:fimbrillin family protein [Bacteroidaceae bacterium]